MFSDFVVLRVQIVTFCDEIHLIVSTCGIHHGGFTGIKILLTIIVFTVSRIVFLDFQVLRANGLINDIVCIRVNVCQILQLFGLRRLSRVHLFKFYMTFYWRLCVSFKLANKIFA